MLDKSKRYLVVGLGLLGGKYALELSKAGFHVDGINRSEGHLQYALDHGCLLYTSVWDSSSPSKPRWTAVRAAAPSAFSSPLPASPGRG